MELIFNESTQKCEKRKPLFATIEVEREEDFTRLQEMLEADREGRCVIFKYGFGSTVYRTWVRPDGSHSFVSEAKMLTLLDLVNAESWDNSYKTREAAEAALKVEKMDKYIKVSDAIDWFRPYSHMEENIPFDVLATDLQDKISTADVAPVVHASWEFKRKYGEADECVCSVCGQLLTTKTGERMKHCPNCGARMDKEA